MITTFKGKTAFVSGGASGIGLAMARAFGRAGMNVAIADVDEAAAKAASEMLGEEQIRSAALRCDVTDRAEMRAAAQETIATFGKVHLVCNNAGVAIGGPIGAVSERDWDWVVDVNLKGVVHGTEVFAPLIRAHGEGGHIVNTASIAGLLAMPRLEPYAATKFAVVAMSEGWAGQLAPEGIGVSVLCPALVRTRIHESGRARQDRYGGAGAVDALGQGIDESAQSIQSGIDPDIVGARVLEAVKAGEFYIFTHPAVREMVQARFAAIMKGFDDADRSEVLKTAVQ